MISREHSSGRLTTIIAVVLLSVYGAGWTGHAAELSLRYGGQGIWPNPATANSQRWFRCEVTYDGAINDDGVPNERIDGLYLYGINYNDEIAAPSGETYQSELTSSKGIWDAGRRASTAALPPVTILDIIEPGRTRFYYSATRYGSPYTYPAGSLAGVQLNITPVLTQVEEEYTVVDNGADYQGAYIIVDTALSVNICRTLSVWDKPSATRVYYRGANLTTVQYQRTALAGRTLRFTRGVAAGNNYPIATNDNNLQGYYIDTTDDLPGGILPAVTVLSVGSGTKFYYTGGPYLDDELIGQTMLFTTGAAAGEERVITDNGTDPTGETWIQSATALPTLLPTLTVASVPEATKFYYTGYAHPTGSLAGLSLMFDTIAGVPPATPTVMTIETNDVDAGGRYITVTEDLPAGLMATDTLHVNDVVRIEDQMHVCDIGWLEDVTHANDRPAHFGVARYTVAGYPDYDYVITVGPFSNYHSDYLVGRIPTTNASPGGNFRFRLYWSTWNSAEDAKYYESQGAIEVEGTQLTTPIALRSYVGNSVPNCGELQAWYSGMASGLDPLVTTRSAPGGPTDPDNGSGSDEYTFRIKFFSGLDAGAWGQWPEIRSQWWRHTDPTQQFGDDYNFVTFNYFAYNIMTGWATPADAWIHDMKWTEADDSARTVHEWLYSPYDDLHRDTVGDSVLLGGHDPEALLIVDGNYNRPYFMVRESGESLRNGIVYKYVVRPTNYLQFLHNIFTLQFDSPYKDAWDVAYWTLNGEPTCNVYASMRPGGHTYEFLTCRDWDPPVWGIGGADPDDVGNFTHAGPCSLALRGMPGRALEAVHLVNEWGNVDKETVELWYGDEDPGGYGYPYDSQDSGKYPKVDPVLTAHPYFEEGPLTGDEQGYPWPGWELAELGPQAPGSQPNPFNPNADAGEPWGPLAGPTYASSVYGGYNASDPLNSYATGISPARFTNEDTIWPNYVNIHPETAMNPFRGGKWTMDTNFVFRINYWQSDNLTPQFIQIFIRQVDAEGNPLGDWQGHSMNKVYPSDSDYTDGCLYYYEASADQLPGGSGDYQYYFRAGDGQHITIYPNRPSDDPGYIGVPPGDNDYYWFRVNNKPQLTNQSVTPGSGTQGDAFEYRTTYYDDDGELGTADHQGDRPFKSILHVDLFGDAGGQAKVTGVAGDVITYELDDGAGTAYADDNLVTMKVRMQTGAAAGQEFEIVANDQAASTITVTGLSGVAAGDLFNIADWFATTMEPENASDTNYRDGAVYLLNTGRAGVVLDEGTHHYYFEFWDNWAYWINWQQYFMDPSAPDPIDQKVEGEMVRFPPEGYFEGPEITANTAPTLSGYFFEPPTADQVASNPSGATFQYTCAADPAGYGNDVLQDMYIQMRTGLAQFKTYQIQSNTTSQITVAGGVNLAADGVAAGNQFRVFADGNGDGFLSWGYDTDTTYEGTPATGFGLYVNYTDAENNEPAVIRLAVCDEVGAVQDVYNMTKVLAEDTTYADGCEYRTVEDVSLSEGIHTIKAQASDGSLWYNGGDASQFFGPKNYEAQAAQGPDIAPNNRPALGFEVGSAEVASVTSATEFTYTDGASLAADPIVVADFGAKGTFRVQSVDHSTQTIVLRSGADLVGAGVAAGDAFTATVELDPTLGFTDTEYTYWIVYTDTDTYGGLPGNAPTFVKVFIDNEEQAMAAWDPTDTDMTDGKVYYYSTSALSASQSHSYYFLASDGLDTVRLPAAPGYFSGPSVNVNNPPLPPPYPPADEWDPINGQSVGTPTPALKWPDGIDNDPWDTTDTLHYIVQISSNETFGTIDYEYDTSDPAYGGAGVTELEMPDALTGGYWYWRVKTVDGAGLESDWSTSQPIDQRFKVDTPPAPPTSGFSPTGEIKTTTPLLQWDAGSDPDGDLPEEMWYYVQLDDDADFSSPLIDPGLGQPGQAQHGVTAKDTTEFQVQASIGLQVGVTYYWRVQTVNGTAANPMASEWSEIQSFTVTDNRAPNPPTTGFAVSGETDPREINSPTPLLSWDEATDPDPADTPETLSYEVEVIEVELDEPADFSGDPGTFKFTGSTAPDVTEITCDPPGDDDLGMPDDNRRINWRVRTVDNGGLKSDWSTVQVFVLNLANEPPLPPQSGFSPNNFATVNTLTPTLRWDPASDPDPYDPDPDNGIYLDYIVQLSSTEFAGGEFEYQYTTTNNSVDITDELTDLSTWQWRVKTVDDEGAESGWSLVQTFKIDTNNQPPQLTPPEGNPNLALDPDNGTIDMNYEYRVVYTDAENDPPADDNVFVEIDEVQYATPLAKADPEDNDYTDGVEYAIAIAGSDPALSYGTHSFRFRTVGAAWPADAGDPAPGPAIGSRSTLGLYDENWASITQLEEGDELYIQVEDIDENQEVAEAEEVTVTVTVAGGSDRETLTLTETGLNTDIFRGSIPTLGKAGEINDGVVNVIAGPVGREVTVEYTDKDDVGSPTADTSTGTVLVVDTVAPAPVQPFLQANNGPAGTSIELDWTEYDEEAQIDVAGYHVWYATTSFSSVAGMAPYATIAAGTQVATITGLQPDSVYHVAVTAFDEVPNEDTDLQSKSVSTADVRPPEIDQFDPAPGATDVPVNTDISFRLTDGQSGIDQSSIQVSVDGTDVATGDLQFSGTDNALTVTYSPLQDLPYDSDIVVQVAAADQSGNALLDEAGNDTGEYEYSFHTEEPPVYSINGEIVDQDGEALADVAVAVYDSDDQKVAETTTDEDGAYEFTDLVAGDYRIVPTKDQYSFDPVQIEVQLVDQSVSGQDFVGILATYTISGRITQNSQGLQDVTVSDGTRGALTDENGDYTITGVPNGTYTVTPTLQYHEFDPTSRTVTVADAPVADVDFTATPELFTVSGTVTDYNDDPLSGVQVTDGTNTATTDAAGAYSLDNVQTGAVTISPSKSGYVFDPSSQEITVPDTLTGVDFVGYTEFTERFPAGPNLIGLPCNPIDSDAQTVFGTDQVARWNPEGQPPDYVLAGEPGSQELLRVQAGRGFFVDFAEATDLSVGGTPVSTSRTFTTALGPLWNMVANPFPSALPMANIQPTNPGTVLPFAFVYDNRPGSASRGSYLLVSAQPGINIARTNLQPWEGAWMRTTGGTSFVEMAPPSGTTAAGAATMEPQALQLGEQGWTIPVVARVAGRCDLTTAVGVGPAVGTYTVPNPPPVSGSVDVYLVDEDGCHLAQAIKPATTDQVSWDLVVTTDIGDSDVDVMLPDLGQVPHDLSVILTDLDTGRSVYARTCSKYTFRSNEHGITRHLRLQVAPRGTDNLIISTASAQPTGQGVVVTYAVTKPCEVTTRVMNISGRIIKTLATGQVVDAGVNTQVWNLRNTAGALIPNGVYLLQVQAIADNGQQVNALCQVNIVR